MQRRTRNKRRVGAGQLALTPLFERPRAAINPFSRGSALIRRTAPRPSPVFDTYWRFAAERQQIFYRRALDRLAPWTSDPILQQFKFTNAYRASDRVSQYLIRHVIHGGSSSFDTTFLRILLFKIFNKIETWETLRASLGEIDESTFDVEELDRILEDQLRQGKRIYSSAYIMPSGGRASGRKHTFHLELVRKMLSDRVPDRILHAKTLRAAYEILLGYSSVGPFLAYQWCIDLNYSEHLDFDEMEFVVPGPGARDGLRKCFVDFGDSSEADIIRSVTEAQNEHFERLGIAFASLWGRPLQLVDCQNLFCETGKYSRVAHPEVMGISRRHRIKQRFHSSGVLLNHWYPPKWRINDRLLETPRELTAPQGR